MWRFPRPVEYKIDGFLYDFSYLFLSETLSKNFPTGPIFMLLSKTVESEPKNSNLQTLSLTLKYVQVLKLNFIVSNDI